MKIGDKSNYIAIKDLKSDPSLTPAMDGKFQDLMIECIQGRTPVFYATVPLCQCVPFDTDYRPDLHPVGKQAIEQTMDQWRKGNFKPLIAYQRGRWFVVSDDYIALFAALNGRPDYVPCWIMGKPDCEGPTDIQGPIALAEVKKVLGLE